MPDVWAQNLYQLVKCSLVLHPEHPSEAVPGPILAPLKVALLQTAVDEMQSLLSMIVLAEQLTQLMVALQPGALFKVELKKRNVRHPLGLVAVKQGVVPLAV